MKRLALALYSTLLGCAGCGGSPAKPTLLAPPPDGAGFQVSMEMEAPAGSETWQCVVMNMPNEDLANVNRVEHVQTPGLHHMDVTALISANLDPGRYDCGKLYADHPELMDQPTLYAAQGKATAQIDLGPGVVAKVPPGLPVLFELHYVNATAQDVHVQSYVNAYTIDAAQVMTSISGGAIRDRHIKIPAMADHTEWTRCVMDHDVDPVLVSTHTHALGRDTHIKLFDGTNVGEELYVNTQWQAPPLEQFTPTRHIPAGTGFEIDCHYVSDQDHEVDWGYFARDEMCNLVLVWTPSEAGAACKQVASSDGILDP
ncbi:MAG: monooxygenase [Polyangia bacterium]